MIVVDYFELKLTDEQFEIFLRVVMLILYS